MCMQLLTHALSLLQVQVIIFSKSYPRSWLCFICNNSMLNKSKQDYAPCHKWSLLILIGKKILMNINSFPHMLQI